jgi:hypothetical protein
MSFLLKDPDAVLDYMVDWGAEYLGVDQLSNSEWSVIPDEPGGVTVVPGAFDGRSAMTGSVTISVVQLGDFAESRPVTTTITI